MLLYIITVFVVRNAMDRITKDITAFDPSFGERMRRPCAPAAPKRPKTGDDFNRSARVTIEQTIERADEWKPVKFKTVCRRASCFGCDYGAATPDESQPALRALWQLFTDNFGRQMSNQNLAELMHEFFESEIRKPMLEQDEVCPEWPVGMILEHIEEHIIEPTVTCANQIRSLKHIERVLFDQVQLENDGGETRIDHKALRGILDVQKQIQALYNSKNTRQLFYSDMLKLDERRANQRD